MTKLLDQILLVSFRYKGEFRESMLPVYRMLKKQGAPVHGWAVEVAHSKNMRSSLLEYMKAAKVVVVDDYNPLLNKFDKAIGQKVVQLWHATGAIKRFGIPCITNKKFIAEYQYDYDLVPVASDFVRVDFSTAFGVAIDNIKPLGIPKTDELINRREDYMPTGVVLYAPTFRDKNKGGRAYFTPPIDFDKFSALLPKGIKFVISSHPAIKHDILDKRYTNIVEINDVPTSTLIKMADILITDYSSMAFDYSLLNRPMAYFSYDQEEYDRGFFVDYDNDMPGPKLKTQEELIEYILSDPATPDYSEFHNKYMGACDGHSTERVCKAIIDMLEE